MPQERVKVHMRGASGRGADDFRLSFAWKSIPNSSVKLLELIRDNDKWRQTLFPPPGVQLGTQAYVLRDMKGYVQKNGQDWEPTEKWHPIQVMTVPTVGHLTRMKRKLLETIANFKVSEDWKEWRDVPINKRDALRDACPELFHLRSLMACSYDTDIVPPDPRPATTRTKRKASTRSRRRSVESVTSSSSGGEGDRKPSLPPSSSSSASSSSERSSSPSTTTRGRSRTPMSSHEVQHLPNLSQKRKRQMTPITISDDSADESTAEDEGADSTASKTSRVASPDPPRREQRTTPASTARQRMRVEIPSRPSGSTAGRSLRDKLDSPHDDRTANTAEEEHVADRRSKKQKRREKTPAANEHIPSNSDTDLPAASKPVPFNVVASRTPDASKPAAAKPDAPDSAASKVPASKPAQSHSAASVPATSDRAASTPTQYQAIEGQSGPLFPADQNRNGERYTAFSLHKLLKTARSDKPRSAWVHTDWVTPFDEGQSGLHDEPWMRTRAALYKVAFSSPDLNRKIRKAKPLQGYVVRFHPLLLVTPSKGGGLAAQLQKLTKEFGGTNIICSWDKGPSAPPEKQIRVFRNKAWMQRNPGDNPEGAHIVTMLDYLPLLDRLVLKAYT